MSTKINTLKRKATDDSLLRPSKRSAKEGEMSDEDTEVEIEETKRRTSVKPRAKGAATKKKSKKSDDSEEEEVPKKIVRRTTTKKASSKPKMDDSDDENEGPSNKTVGRKSVTKNAASKSKNKDSDEEGGTPKRKTTVENDEPSKLVAKKRSLADSKSVKEKTDSKIRDVKGNVERSPVQSTKRNVNKSKSGGSKSNDDDVCTSTSDEEMEKMFMERLSPNSDTVAANKKRAIGSSGTEPINSQLFSVWGL